MCHRSSDCQNNSLIDELIITKAGVSDIRTYPRVVKTLGQPLASAFELERQYFLADTTALDLPALHTRTEVNAGVQA